MSRILRRPLFRGGPVSSYGTGIASGLADGGRVALESGGDLLGFKPRLRTFNTQAGVPKLIKGGELGQFKKVAPAGEIIEEVVNEEIPAGTGENLSNERTRAGANLTDVVGVKDETKEKVVDKGKGSQWEYWDALGEAGEMPLKVAPSDEEIYQQKVLIATNKANSFKFLTDNDRKLLDENGITYGRDLFDSENKEEIIEKNKEIAEGVTLESTTVAEEGEDPDIVNALKDTGDDSYTEEPELDAKTMVAQNKELFAELLGGDKARGQDISEMLLGFSGAQGNTVKEKFQNFAREEAKRPGKYQKINETAAGLAIQDYVAGKRSKEQIDKLMKVEDYRMGLKAGQTKVDPSKDKWRDALDKTVLKYAGREGKTDSIGIIAETLRKYEPGKTIRSKTGINPKKEAKAMKDLKIGITIVAFSDGTKKIIDKKGPNNFTDLTSKYPI